MSLQFLDQSTQGKAYKLIHLKNFLRESPSVFQVAYSPFNFDEDFCWSQRALSPAAFQVPYNYNFAVKVNGHAIRH